MKTRHTRPRTKGEQRRGSNPPFFGGGNRIWRTPWRTYPIFSLEIRSASADLYSQISLTVETAVTAPHRQTFRRHIDPTHRVKYAASLGTSRGCKP